VKGSYAVLLRLDNSAKIKVGRLDRVKFAAGYYIYVGSAQQGLACRIRRYLAEPLKKTLAYRLSVIGSADGGSTDHTRRQH